MALIMYLTRAPRYKNIITDEYETIPRKDIELINDYFNWKRAQYDAKYNDGKYYAGTLEEWCGVSESELPHKYIINYYHDFYTQKKWYSEMAGSVEGYSIFEQLARIVKANQIFNWFVKNVMGDNVDQKYYEVTKQQLESLLDACNKVKDSCTVNQGEDEEYIANENVAKEYLPILENQGYFFGTNNYDACYTKQVVDTVDIIKSILETTDFEKQTIYVNAVW